MRVLFYTNTPRAFRTTLIGYLWELAQEHRIVLLSEELDQKTANVIRDKSLFPGIEKIVQVRQHTRPDANIIRRHRYLSSLASQAVNEYRPDVVFASSDWHSFFEMYLLRHAKRKRILRITIQDTFNIAEMRKQGLWLDLYNLHTRTPKWLPWMARAGSIAVRKYFGHALLYWVMPVLAGETPFGGASSFVLFRGHSGSRYSNYHIVMSQRDYDLHVRNGVRDDKLLVLPHPLTRAARTVFQVVLQMDMDGIDRSVKTAGVMLPAEEIGFCKKDFALIPRDKVRAERLELLKIMIEVLPGWRIMIKPHPATRGYSLLKERMESISDCITVLEPQSNSDVAIESADVIMEFPRAAGTTLLSATIQCPEKPVLALDFRHEFLGDSYRDFPGVHYIDRMDQFRRVLEEIREGRYFKDVRNVFDADPPNSQGICALLDELLARESGKTQ